MTCEQGREGQAVLEWGCLGAKWGAIWGAIFAATLVALDARVMDDRVFVVGIAVGATALGAGLVLGLLGMLLGALLNTSKDEGTGAPVTPASGKMT